MEIITLRKCIEQYALDNDLEIIFLENPNFDKSIIGISEDGKLIYVYENMIYEFMEDNKCTYEEAVEFIEYNTIRALYYIPNHPIILKETTLTLKEKVDEYVEEKKEERLKYLRNKAKVCPLDKEERYELNKLEGEY